MPHFVEVLAWLSAALIAVGVIWSKGIVPTAHWIRSATTQIKRALGIIDTLADIAAEFKPNAGKTLRDQIAFLRADVAEVKETQASLTLDVSEVKRQVENIITEELPIITALAEAIVIEQEHVAHQLERTDPKPD